MWRGRTRYFSTSTWSSPKLDFASRWQEASAAANSAPSFDDAHALAAAAGAGLDQHRIADRIGLLLQEGRILVVPVVARHQRDT